MPDIILSVDEQILRKVRKVAVEQNTTLTAMVRDYLASVADSDREDRERAVDELDRTFVDLSRPMGPRRRVREGLYERGS